MNAGGVPNTCKSSGPLWVTEAVSGGRVSNTWVTYLGDRDNISKGVLIPDTFLGAQALGRKGGASGHPQMGLRPIS